MKEDLRPFRDDRPIIVLVGGIMTIDDGATLDSRQPIDGDDASYTIHNSLATSLLWWLTTISLVKPMLESAKGADPFVLINGQRSVIELLQDGTFRMTRLARFLPGGASELRVLRTHPEESPPEGYVEAVRLLEGGWRENVVQSQAEEPVSKWQWVEGDFDKGTVWCDSGKVGKPWRFFKGNDWWLPTAMQFVGPAVVVDTTKVVPGSLFAHSRNSRLERLALDSSEGVLVLPHTSATEEICKDYCEWVAHGRPNDPSDLDMTNAFLDFEERQKPFRNVCPVPIEAEFAVTGVVQDGEWKDPAALEAARSLLATRYDLKIGFWDLVNNVTLRQTLLATRPYAPSPQYVAKVPERARQRSLTIEERASARKVEEIRALEELGNYARSLFRAGWKISPRYYNSYQFPMTEILRPNLESDPTPLVSLWMAISKGVLTVSADTALYQQISLEEYACARHQIFEEIARPYSSVIKPRLQPVLLRIEEGWGDSVDWAPRFSEIAERTVLWRSAFAELVELCLLTQEENLKGNYVRRELFPQ